MSEELVMRLRFRIVQVLPVACALLVLSGCAKPILNRPVPRFQAELISGGKGKISSAQFKGKPTVINFWASWCNPCRLEMPIFDSLARTRYKGRVNFLVIATSGDNKPAALKFLQDERIKMPAAFDEGDKIGSKFGVHGLPITVIIDHRGYVVDRLAGAVDADTLTEAVDSVLRISEQSAGK